MARIYHVGLAQEGRTAVFQHRKDKDFLSCELLDYYGERFTTKAGARRRLAVNKPDVLATLAVRYPGRFNNVRID